MNIFVLDRDPKVAAHYHCDKHVVKMLLEYGQLLISAFLIVGPHKQDSKDKFKHIRDAIAQIKSIRDLIPQFPFSQEKFSYLLFSLNRVANYNNKLAKWTRESIENWNWLLEMSCALCSEYTLRYKKTHSLEKVFKWLQQNPPQLPARGMISSFILAVAEDCKLNNAVESYRLFYNKHKNYFAKWKNTETPFWYKPIIQDKEEIINGIINS